jgi:hypothetical protein
MIVNDLCYGIVKVRNLENHMQIAARCARREIASGAENLLLQALQFH